MHELGFGDEIEHQKNLLTFYTTIEDGRTTSAKLIELLS